MNSVLAFAGRHGPLLLFFGVLIGFLFPGLAAAAKPWMGASVFVFTLGAFLKVDGNAFRSELRRPGRAAAVLAWTLVSGVLVLIGFAAPTLAASGEPLQHARKSAVAKDLAIDTTADRSDEKDQFRAYITWLAAAHAHAALHGEDVQLPRQF